MKNNQGFTLVEVMIAGFIMVAVGAGIVGLQIIVTQNQLTAFNSYTAVEESNSIIASFTRELRGARQSEAGGFPFVTMDDNEIIFFSDSDFDGATERVRYTLVGSVLSKGIIQPVGVPAVYDPLTEIVIPLSVHIDNGANPIFFYFNGAWPTDLVNNPLLVGSRFSDTRLVRVALNVLIPSDTNPENFALEGHVQPRTLKDNL